MSVHYKFKSALDFDTITFDGLHISVGDLKKAIIRQKRLGKISDFDLQITNAQTKEEYNDDSCVIPKNTSLVIARIPLAHHAKKSWDPQADKPTPTRSTAKVDGAGFDLSKMQGSEEDKIQAMMLQSTVDYDPKSYQRIRGQTQTGEVPPTYVCNKCKKGGHWIKNCPFNVAKEHIEIKRNTGIPRSFREKKEGDKDEVLPQPPAVEKKLEIPDDLLCSICHDLYTDAVMIPCCGSSFCDDCVRTALLESEDNECPDCKEKGSSPGSLIPNRFLRNCVNAFKNETGYKVTHIKKVTNDDTNSREKKPTEDSEEKTTAITATDATEEHVETKEEEEKEDTPKADEDENTQTPSETNGEKSDKPEESVEIETDSNEIQQKTEIEPKPQSHHDSDSDFEDNITIKMPTAQRENRRTLLPDNSYNMRNPKHLKPPGIDSSPHNHIPVSPLLIHRSDNMPPQHADWRRDYRDPSMMDGNTFDMNMDQNNLTSSSAQHNNMLPQYMGHMELKERPIRPMNPHDMYGGPPQPGLPPPPQHMYPPMGGHPQMGQDGPPPMGAFDNMYNHMGPRPGFNRYPHFVRAPFRNVNSGYPPPLRGMHGEPRQMVPTTGNLASVYQCVAAKVGTGIIDDPLEAFNRIMKEKEKRKEERRRSPLEHSRRSRSPELSRNINRFRTSPYNHRPPRDLRDNRARSRNREQRNLPQSRAKLHESDKFYRHKHSDSFSDRSSRSRSWSKSPLPKKRSKSPMNYRRSRNQSHSHIGEKFQQMDKPYFGRKDDKYMIGSPKLNHRRSRSRGRSNWQSNTLSNDDYKKKNFQRGDNRSPFTKRSPSPPPQFKQRDPEKLFTRFEPSHMMDTLEPPPPGFENNCGNNWTNGGKNDPNNFVRSTTPDLYEKFASHDMDSRNRVRDNSSRAERSLSRSSGNSYERKRKYPRRSTTPISKSGSTKTLDMDDITGRKSRNAPHSHNSKDRERGGAASDAFGEKKPNRSSHSHKEQIGEISEKYGEQKRHDKKVDKSAASADTVRSASVQKPTVEDVEDAKKAIEEKEDGDKDYPKDDKTKKHKERKRKRKEKEKEKTERKKMKKEKKEKKEKHKHKSTADSELALAKKTSDDDDKALDSENICAIGASPLLNVSQNETEDGEVAEEKESNPFATEPQHKLDDDEEEGEISAGDADNDVDDLPKKTFSREDGVVTSVDFKRFDSVLDIHGYDTDFEDVNGQQQKIKVVATIPELSKWELDEPISVVTTLNSKLEPDESSEKYANENVNERVTNEVLRKAENAIFTRAINAIRPMEHKLSTVVSTSTDSSSKYNTGGNEICLQISNAFADNVKENIKSFQITVPSSSSQERSVEIKNDGRNKSSHSPPRLVKGSVKDRLGSKIVNKRISSQVDSTAYKNHRNRASHSEERNISRTNTHERAKDPSDKHRNTLTSREREKDEMQGNEPSTSERDRSKMRMPVHGGRQHDYRNRVNDNHHGGSHHSLQHSTTKNDKPAKKYTVPAAASAITSSYSGSSRDQRDSRPDRRDQREKSRDRARGRSSRDRDRNSKDRDKSNRNRDKNSRDRDKDRDRDRQTMKSKSRQADTHVEMERKHSNGSRKMSASHSAGSATHRATDEQNHPPPHHHHHTSSHQKPVKDNSSKRRSEEKSTGEKHQQSTHKDVAESSSASEKSDSDSNSDDAKRRKKSKDKKRTLSSSSESTTSAKRRHSKSKRSSKSAKKKKKSKK